MKRDTEGTRSQSTCKNERIGYWKIVQKRQSILEKQDHIGVALPRKLSNKWVMPSNWPTGALLVTLLCCSEAGSQLPRSALWAAFANDTYIKDFLKKLRVPHSFENPFMRFQTKGARAVQYLGAQISTGKAVYGISAEGSHDHPR
jgi:hypothetical protein